MKTDKRIDNCSPGNRKMKTVALKLGTWDVRTMTPGFSDYLQEVNDVCKTAVIDRELSRLQMDTVALQEIRLPEIGSEGERLHPVPAGQITRRGQRTRRGFAVRNRLLEFITPLAKGAERIMSLRLQTSSGPVSLIRTYAPTLASTAEAKDKFYDDLSAAVSGIPDRELLFIASDFNARESVDHNSWPTCLG